MRWLVVVILAGCSHDALPGAMLDGGRNDLATGCPRDAPNCAHGCGSDWWDGPLCENGRWRCPPGTIDINDCPPGTCWGPPTPGEVCGPNGWECKPDDSDYAFCPELMCPHCTQFDAVVEKSGCRCQCLGGEVRCKKI